MVRADCVGKSRRTQGGSRGAKAWSSSADFGDVLYLRWLQIIVGSYDDNGRLGLLDQPLSEVQRLGVFAEF